MEQSRIGWTEVVRRSEVLRPRAGSVVSDECRFRFVLLDQQTFRVEEDGNGLVRAGSEVWLIRSGIAEYRRAEPISAGSLLDPMLWPGRFDTSRGTPRQVLEPETDVGLIRFVFPSPGSSALVDRDTGTIVRLERPDGSRLAEIVDLRIADTSELVWDGPLQEHHTRDGVAFVACDDGVEVLASWQWDPGSGMPGYAEDIVAASLEETVAAALQLTDRVVVRTQAGEYEAGPLRGSDDDLPAWPGSDRP